MKKIALVGGALMLISGVAVAAPQWFSPYCKTGKLKRNGVGPNHTCEVVENKAATCPSGYTYKRVEVGKDKCEKITATAKAAYCNLLPTDKKSNWKINKVKGADYCTHKTKNKGTKKVTCLKYLNHSLSIDSSGNTDQCLDGNAKVKQDASCPAGYTHKTGGQDSCEKTSYVAPSFK